MTLLAGRVRFYYRCRADPDHTFERSTNDARFCPTCAGAVFLYGVADSTLYAADEDDESEDPQGPPVSPPGS